MTVAAPAMTGSPADLDATIDRAAAALRAAQRPDGHWVFELEADATIPAEYVLLRHYLGEPVDAVLEAKIGRYLRRIQSARHDGWALYHDGAFDVSASVKAYYALRMIGDDPQAPHLARARAAIRAAGGAAAVNVFTRIQLALFGAGAWSAVPTLPPELILAPRWFPVHLSRMSYWSRTVVVPLLVIAARKPLACNPKGVRIDELYLDRDAALTSRAADRKWLWSKGFAALDRLLKVGEPLWPARLRARAVAACEAWVLERLNGVDGLGAIYPAMANSVMMLDCLGYPPDHPARAAARESVERLLVVGEEEAYCQPCVSPVWDTALAALAMMEAGADRGGEASADAALGWLAPLQVTGVKGDWAEAKPDVRPGGWAFQYRNDHYPDLDDTAVVVMAMDRAKGRLGPVHDAAIARGVEWTVGLQSKDGGFAAFDADNSHHYLNNLPFADHGALLDPSTADVSARVVSMLAQLGETAETSPRMAAALGYLAAEQEAEGSWFGRWGVNYVYGTWSVLCALGAAGLARETPMVARAVGWLAAIQNEDGGWGESCDSYDLARTGHLPAPSTASQTAWALLGLMAVGEVDHPAVARGVAWLQARQEADGLWGQEHHTGGGFPRVFYLRYHGYPKYFPLWAVARYRNLTRSNAKRPEWGM